MSSLIGGGGVAMNQLISIHVDLDTGLSRCAQKAFLWLIKLQTFLQEWQARVFNYIWLLNLIGHGDPITGQFHSPLTLFCTGT